MMVIVHTGARVLAPVLSDDSVNITLFPRIIEKTVQSDLEAMCIRCV